MPDVRFDCYYRYTELTRILKDFAATYPDLIQLESIGQSYEKREIWLVTVTNHQTQAAQDKPAVWIDGNIHATEIAPSSVCLYFLDVLTKGYKNDPEITRCLNTRTFYICPRVNPDGAELALADKPKFLRSGTRFYPNPDAVEEGLIEEDIDGDGRILLMRIPDNNGPWKVSPVEPRLLVRRDPTETGGQYYRVFREGRIENYDGVSIPIQPLKEGLDFNRNFPFMWREESEQKGAGDYPTSEAEVRSLVEFISNSPNIIGALSFHTMSGVLLRPYSHQSDDNFPPEDLQVYEKIGEEGTKSTGYKAISIYHNFRSNAQEYVTGAFDDWMYEHRGVFAWTVEVWSPMEYAGIQNYHLVNWFSEHPFEDDLKLLEWSDRELNGEGYIDWYAWEHPQLGQVELGGWNGLYFWRNPPQSVLEKEVRRFPKWLVWNALISPCLELYETKVEALGDNTYYLRVVVQNIGWLPTYITQKALEKKLARGCLCFLKLPSNVRLKMGKEQEDMGHLEGRAYKASALTWRTGDATSDRAVVEWIVQGEKGSIIEVEIRCDRAGVVKTQLQFSE
ncbi:MAG: M14 family metallopeptidase [Spirulinaceae cyanobacterium]